VLLLTAAAVASLVCVAYLGHVLGSIEDWTMDKRFAIHGAHTPDDVAVVAIDDKSLHELGQWPFPRRYHAQLIRKLADDRPGAIAMSIQFTEQSDPVDDSALTGAVASAAAFAVSERAGRGQVVLGTTEVSQYGGTNVFGGNTGAARVGVTLYRSGANGVLRTLSWGSPTTWRNGEPAIPVESFALVAAEIATGRPIPPSRIRGSTPIAYVGPPGTVPTYSYINVLRGRVPASAFKGKVVVIGPTARSLQDIHTTPYGAGRQMGGAEIDANAIETALHDFPLSPSRTRSLLLIVLFSFLVPVASIFLRWRWCLLGAAVAAVLYLVAAQLSFDHGLLLAVTWPLLALLLGTVAAGFLQPPPRAREA
jgi:CHASE2 domain-containing sensor protein